MSYPQPNADLYAIKGYKFFRLNTLIASPGDIYESPQSAHAFALGPQSDISAVNLAYFDDQADNFVDGTEITPQRSWVGRIDARNEARYTPSGRPGRILIWPAELYDPSFLPAGFNPMQDHLYSVTPRLDVIQFFTPQTSLVPQRNDREFLFQELPLGLRTSYAFVPYYGRKYASIRISNQAGGDAGDYTIDGVTFYTNANGDAIQKSLATGNLVAGASAEKVVRATVDGMFDYLLVGITATDPLNPPIGPFPIEIITSDNLG